MAETVEMTLQIPSNDWVDDVLEQTRFDTFDDFVTQILDSTAASIEAAENLNCEEMTVELPKDSVERFVELRDKHRGKDPDAEQTISVILQSTYVQNNHR